MGAFNKRMKQIRSGSTGNRVLDALQLVIPAVILTADDLWCVTNEQAQLLVKGSFEIIEGYGESKDGLIQLHKEFAERGFQIDLHNGFTTPDYNPIAQRGRGEWWTVEVEEECVNQAEKPMEKCEKKVKKKTLCSRCKKGTAIRTNYCSHCGADMRPRENNNDA